MKTLTIEQITQIIDEHIEAITSHEYYPAFGLNSQEVALQRLKERIWKES